MSLKFENQDLDISSEPLSKIWKQMGVGASSYVPQGMDFDGKENLRVFILQPYID